MGFFCKNKVEKLEERIVVTSKKSIISSVLVFFLWMSFNVQVLRFWVTNHFSVSGTRLPPPLGSPVHAIPGLLNKCVKNIVVTSTWPQCVPYPLYNHPSHAIRCSSQSRNLKVNPKNSNAVFDRSKNLKRSLFE